MDHQPFMKPVEFPGLRRGIVQQTEQYVDRVKNDQRRAHLPRFRLQHHQQRG
jgi:hypothetical protein